MNFLSLTLIICTFLLTFQYKYSDTFELNKNMKIQKYANGIIIIDNFYKFPSKVRDFALQQNFKPHLSIYKTMCNDPNFVYKKHKTFVKTLEEIETKIISKSNWDANITMESNGYFQYLTKNDKPTIHTDAFLRSLIVYLSPYPPQNSGISFYKHNASGIFKEDSYEAGETVDPDLKKKEVWTSYFTCKNRFNRAIIFDGNLFHAGQGGFGSSKYNSRLFQTFFYKLSPSTHS